MAAQVEPITDTHVASPFDVAFVVDDDEAGAAGAPLVACAVCADADGCDDEASFVEVDLIDGGCGPRTAIACEAGENVVIVARVVDAAGNVGSSTLTRTCSLPPASAPVVESVDTPPGGATTTITWSGPAPAPGDAGVDHFVVTTRIDGGAPESVDVPGPLSHALTLPACVVVDVEVAAVDVFGRSSPAGARRGQTHCGHDGTFSTITLEIDATGSANLVAMNAARDLTTVADIDLGDVDHDGDLDVVVFGERGNGARRVLRLEQLAPPGGGPLFAGSDLINPATDGNARQVLLADLNADGHLDIVAMTGQATALLNGIGDGGFAAPTVFAFGRSSAVVGPVTRGDGLSDLLLSASDQILPGTRGATTPVACAAGTTLLALVDGDGLPGAELLVYDPNTDLLRLRRRDGAAAACPFSAVSTDVYTRTQNNLVTAVVLDIDGNGRPDLARLGTREVVIDRDAAFLPSGTAATTPVFLPRDTVAAAAIDLESDGDEDLVVIDDRSPGSVRFVVVEQGTLTLGDVIPLNGILRQVEVADVDGDGIDDVLVAAESPPAVHILKGGGVRRRGDGGAVLFHEVAIAGAVAAVPFDADRDGDVDVVTAGRDGVFAIDVDVAGVSSAQLVGAQTVTAFATGVTDAVRGASVLFGNAPAGDWSLVDQGGAIESLAPASGPARALDTIDIDDDGDLDALGVFPELAVRLNEGGSFVPGPAAPATTTNAAALAVADIDLDGFLDVVIAGDEVDIVALQPTVALEGTLACAGGPARDVAIADVDADGHADLLVACGGATPALLIAHNNGDSPATFALTGVAPGGDDAGPLAVGDIDSDGDPDVVLGSDDAGTGALRVLRNDGGAFVVAGDLFGAAGRRFRDVQLVDIDDDGPLDVVATLGDGTVAILHGTAVAR